MRSRGLRAHLFLVVATTAGAIIPTAVQAQSAQGPGENRNALPGLLRIGVPTEPSPFVAVAGTFGYGIYNAGSELSGPSHQIRGNLSAAITPLPLLSFRASLDGLVNLHHDGDSSMYGEPQLAARVRGALTEDFHLGGEIEARFVGEAAPDIHFAATTPTFRALGAYRLLPTTWLAANLGFRLDNTALAAPDPQTMTPADRVTLGASDFNALELGLGASHRIHRTELLAEITADVLLGNGAPSFGQSPISFSLGARHELNRLLLINAALDLSPSARPDPFPDTELIVVRPRAGLMAGLVVRLGLPEEQLPREQISEKEAEKDPEEVVTPPAPVIASGGLKGQIVDEGGHPIPDVKVILTQDGAEPLEIFSDANGNFTLSGVPLGDAKLSAQTAGFDPKAQQLKIVEGEEQELEIVLYPSLPAGQVRGKVLSLSGAPVQAKVTFSPGDKIAEVDTDGSFTIDLPPGNYTVRFEHPDFPAQKRSIKIVDKGVVVLNIALEK